MSGIAGALCGNPLDIILVRKQAFLFEKKQNLGIINSLQSIIRNEGLLKLWRGISATSLRVVLIKFWTIIYI